jgi:iron complex outermembrane receptor protein
MKIWPLLVTAVLPFYVGANINDLDKDYLQNSGYEEDDVGENADEEIDDEFEDDFYGDDDFVSIATGTKQLLHKAPSVATVITSEKIKRMGAVGLDEVLESVPGLHVSHISNDNLPVYTFRGIYTNLNPQVLVLINGLPITNMFVGNRSMVWGGMNVEGISRIEIIRGPGSAVYGADAFAGVINVITKDADGINGTEMGVRFGSFSTTDAWFSHGGIYGDLKASFVFEHHSTDGFKEIIESDAQTFYDGQFGTDASLAPGPMNNYRNNNDFRVDLGYGNWRFRTGLQQRTIGSGGGAADALDPSSRQSSDRWNADLSYQSSNIAEHWYLEGIISYFDTSTEVDNNLFLFPPGTDIGFPGGAFANGIIGNPEVFERHERINLTTRYEGIENHLISIGGGYSREDIYKVNESKNFGLDGEGNYIFPGEPVVDVTGTPFVFMNTGYRENNYLYIQDEIKLAPDWDLTLGIRQDDYSDFGKTTNPRLALVWTTSLAFTTKLLYGEAFRAPSYAETRLFNNPVTLGNPDLKPENMESLELAFDYHPGSEMRLGFSLFSYDWKDIVQFVPDPGLTTKTAQNTGRQKGHGLEVEFEWTATDVLKFSGNYSWQRSENKLTGDDSPYAPRQQIYLMADYTINDNFDFFAKTYWILDRLRAGDDLRGPIGDYNITDFNINWHSENYPIGFRLIARNVFDKDAKHQTENDGPIVLIPNDLPMPGRSFDLEFNYKF